MHKLIGHRMNRNIERLPLAPTPGHTTAPKTTQIKKLKSNNVLRCNSPIFASWLKLCCSACWRFRPRYLETSCDVWKAHGAVPEQKFLISLFPDSTTLVLGKLHCIRILIFPFSFLKFKSKQDVISRNFALPLKRSFEQRISSSWTRTDPPTLSLITI